MVVAPKGKKLVMCDLSQAESWVVAYMADDPNMIHSLNFSDIHSDTAEVLFDDQLAQYPKENWNWKVSPFLEMRYIGKRNNHANSYGMGPERNAQVINKDSDQPPYVVVSVAQCRVYQAKWHSHYFCVKTVYWAFVEYELSKSRTLTNLYGRRRTFYGAWGKELFKEGYADIPQSTVADHFNGLIHPELGVRGGLKAVYEDIVRPSNGDIRLINQSHDSCMLEVPDSLVDSVANQTASLLKRPLLAPTGKEFTIPVDCEVGERWGEMEKFKLSA